MFDAMFQYRKERSVAIRLLRREKSVTVGMIMTSAQISVATRVSSVRERKPTTIVPRAARGEPTLSAGMCLSQTKIKKDGFKRQ